MEAPFHGLLIEQQVIFLEIVYLDLYSDKVWAFSIFSFCTPPGYIYGRPLLIIDQKQIFTLAVLKRNLIEQG